MPQNKTYWTKVFHFVGQKKEKKEYKKWSGNKKSKNATKKGVVNYSRVFFYSFSKTKKNAITVAYITFEECYKDSHTPFFFPPRKTSPIFLLTTFFLSYSILIYGIFVLEEQSNIIWINTHSSAVISKKQKKKD